MNININEFLLINNDIDRKDFYINYTKPIDINTPIDDYYGDVIYSHQLSTINNHLSDNNLHKFMIINFDGDSVMVCMKLVNMFKYVYLRVQIYPCSLNGIKANELIVYNKLKELDAFEKMWVSTFDKSGWDYKTRILDLNFYDKIDTRWVEINSPKWLKKRKINRFLTDNTFGLHKASTDDYDSTIACLNVWCDGKDKLHNIKIINNIKNNYEWLINNENIEFLLAKYRGDVIGAAIFGKFGGNSYQSIFKFSHTSRTNAANEDDDPRYCVYLHKSAQIMNYFHIKYFKKNTTVEYLTYAGSTSTSLKKYKQKNYSDVIKYYGVDIS